MSTARSAGDASARRLARRNAGHRRPCLGQLGPAWPGPNPPQLATAPVLPAFIHQLSATRVQTSGPPAAQPDGPDNRAHAVPRPFPCSRDPCRTPSGQQRGRRPRHAGCLGPERSRAAADTADHWHRHQHPPAAPHCHRPAVRPSHTTGTPCGIRNGFILRHGSRLRGRRAVQHRGATGSVSSVSVAWAAQLKVPLTWARVGHYRRLRGDPDPLAPRSHQARPALGPALRRPPPVSGVLQQIWDRSGIQMPAGRTGRGASRLPQDQAEPPMAAIRPVVVRTQPTVDCGAAATEPTQGPPWPPELIAWLQHSSDAARSPPPQRSLTPDDTPDRRRPEA